MTYESILCVEVGHESLRNGPTAVYTTLEMSCESRLHTLQMLELCKTLKDKAEILYKSEGIK